ncbi:MAG TPA: class I SAM-dependent methyltransferase [Thermomicrobiales bacterium]|nr:class I SAM-dependent methyltransferase [Thermomicrobiales bacterium]
MATEPRDTTGGGDYLTRHLQEMAPHRALLRAVECRFMGRVPLTHPVLDVGCGDGHFASVAFTEPIDVGLDPMDRDLVEAAARRPAVYQDVVKGSATGMPFPDGTFATVVSNCVIEHIPDVAATLSEISRVLRPGGVFATTLPSEHYPEYLLGAILARRAGFPRLGRAYGSFFNRISHHEHVDPPDVWIARLGAVGLDVTEHAYYFSPSAHRVFDIAHYIGAPSLISKRLTGKWVIHPVQAKVLERWYRRYYEEPLPAEGAYQFVQCVKRP